MPTIGHGCHLYSGGVAVGEGGGGGSSTAVGSLSHLQTKFEFVLHFITLTFPFHFSRVMGCKFIDEGNKIIYLIYFPSYVVLNYHTHTVCTVYVIFQIHLYSRLK